MSRIRSTTRRRVMAVLALIMVAGSVDLDVGPAAARDVLPQPIGVIVGLVPGESIEAVAARHATTSIDAIPALSAYLVTWTDARTADQVADELALDPAVDFANRNLTTRAPEVAFSGRIYKWTSAPPSDVVTQWAAGAIGLAAAHATTTGTGVTVAVLDTGIVAGPGFEGVVVQGIDFVDGDMVPGDDLDGIDQNSNGVIDEAAGHGTHVAGIVHMVAPTARIMPVRVLDSDGNSDTFTVAEAMLWAGDHGANVVNLSLGQAGSSTLLRKATAVLWSRDVVVVGAAGNEARNRDSFPAGAKCAIGVAASDQQGRLADFSSYGSSVDVAAPGVEIVSVFPFSATGAASWSGTSMAAPMVAGEVALLRSQRPDLRIGAIARLVVTSGVALIDPPGSIVGIRRIDVAAAVSKAAGAVTNTEECLQ